MRGPIVNSNFSEEHDYGMTLDPIDVARNGLGYLPRENILRRVEGCVDPAAPLVFTSARYLRQLEIERVPIRVEDQVME